jgi:hypothetical protein
VGRAYQQRGKDDEMLTNLRKLVMIYDAVESKQQSLCGEDGLSEGEEAWVDASPDLLKYLELLIEMEEECSSDH